MIRENANQASHPIKITRPLFLKFYDELEPNRMVIYRQNIHEMGSFNNGSQRKPKFFAIEISKTKTKMYILAIKIPLS